MDNQEYLLGQIRVCKRKLNMAKCIDCGILAAAAGGCVGVFLEFISLFWHFYDVHLAAGLCFVLGFSAGIVYAVCRRADMRQAARRLDSYGLRERMLTAYEQIETAKATDDEFVRLQREDAVLHYNQIRDQVKISLMPAKRHVLALVLAAAAVVGMGFIPSPVRDEAQLRHQVQVQAKEEKEELEELIEALKAVDTEKLTEEQSARLQELSEALKLSAQELTQADSWESLAAAAERLTYKYHQAEVGLERLASQLGNLETAGLADAMALAKAAANQNGQQTASAGTAASAGNGTGDSQGDSAGDSQGDGSGGSQGDGTGGSQGDGSGGSQGGGTGGSQGDGSGDGTGGGTGDSQGDGSSGSQGSGSNSGDGAGGRGTGSSSTVHDYVSIPNAIANDSSLTGNKYGDENSDYFRQQNGLAWEGEHVEYNSVIGKYTENAYEGIANGRYPSGMESVIRNYFENLNK